MVDSLGKLFVELGVDASGLDKGLGKAKTDISGLGSAFQKHGKAIGAGMTAAGVGVIALTDSSMKTNAALGTTALQLGITTKEMRGLALETANVTFPLSEVTASFDLLTRAGMKNSDNISATATAFDTLGDAVGLPASEVTTRLIPAFNAFNIPLEDAAEHTDTFTHLMRNTTVELSDFSGMVNYLAADLDTMDMSLEESVAVMEALADKGIQGSAATREFRTAVTAAEGDTDNFYEALGLTAEEVATYTDKVESADGMTQKFADAQNKQFSTMDKLKHALSEATLNYGSLLEPVEALGPIMATLGPIMILASTMNWAHAASAWAAVAPYLAIIAPILAVIGILAILEMKFGFVTKTIGFFADALSPVIGGIKGFLGIARDAADSAEDLAYGVEEEAHMMNTAEIAADALADAQKNVADSAAEVDTLTSAYEELQGAIADALGITEDLDDQSRSIEHAQYGLEDAEKKYAKAVAEHGVNSDEAARADLRRRDAVDRLDDAEKKLVELEAEHAEANTKKNNILKANDADSIKDLESMLHNKQAQHKDNLDKEIRAKADHDKAILDLDKHRSEIEIKNAEKTAEKTESIWDTSWDSIVSGLSTHISKAIGFVAGLGDKLLLVLGPIGAVIYAFKHWDEIVSIISSVFGKVFDFLMNLDSEFKKAGWNLMVALAKGITSGISETVDAVKGALGTVRSYLPFSDAKVGPLSDLTASGAALMTTFEKGMGSVDLSGKMEHILPQPIAAPAASTGQAGGSVSNSSTISMGDIHLSRDYGFEDMMKDLNRHQAQNRTQRGA